MHISLNARREELHEAIYKAFDGKVQAGPFKGMSIVGRASWGSGDIGPKIIGCYEQELHPFLAVQVSYNTVVNIGCAEGYYAVGMARLLPDAEVFAFDIDAKAQEICRLNAEANGVAARVSVGGECTAERIQELAARPGKTLMIVDCEGGELALIGPHTAPALTGCDLIVECHDFLDRSITPSLAGCLAATHNIEIVSEGARDPNIQALRGWHSIDRWLAVNEGRPETMHWIIASCLPKRQAL